MMKGHSVKCLNLSTYWNKIKCDTCAFKPGYEVSPNCGRDDEGSIHELPFKPCKNNTFNPGDGPHCRPCSVCLSVVKNCTSTNDIVCQPLRNELTTTTTSIATLSNEGSTTQPSQENKLYSAPWVLPFAIVVAAMLLALSAFVIIRKRKKGQQKMCCDRGSTYSNLSPADKLIDPEVALNADIRSAPLQTVLDNLDVLEELVILLDPDIQGIKNTKHLASLCSFPSTWITYVYSMKESKSPLRAVLEGVTSRYPDWTVGHLAKLLRQMERIDAIAVLAKLSPSPHINV